MRRLIILLFLAQFLFSCKKTDPLPGAPDDFIIAGYLPSWGMDNVDMNILENIDILYYFSITPDADGSFFIPDGMSADLSLIRTKLTKPNSLLFLVLGGWYESETIFPMAADPVKRDEYVHLLMEYCRQHNIDGIDLDWEDYPQQIPENDHFGLVTSLSDSLRADGKFFSVAMAVSKSVFTATFEDKLDFVNVMCYDIFDEIGNHAPLTLYERYSHEFINSGIPKEKLIMGVPFYSERPYVYGDTSPRFYTYRKIVEFMHPAADVNKYGVYSFNGRGLMKKKSRFLIENDIRGIMAWELSQDVALSSEYSLVNAILQETGRD